MPKSGKIFNIQHFCLNDGAGIRTVVFFKGCPLNCIWCHNPESKSSKFELSFSAEKCVSCMKCAEICDKNVHTFGNGTHFINRQKCISCRKCTEICNFSALEIIGNDYTSDEIIDEISKDDIFFGDDGGVTFSGGEPFMQFDFLYECLKKCKQKGYSTYIETSGFAKTEDIIKASKYTDCFLFDCKETDSGKHKKFTGIHNSVILRNLQILDELNIPVILRCPIIPAYNDRYEHFTAIAEIANSHKNILSVELEAYHPLGERKCKLLGRDEHKILPPTDEEKESWLKFICDKTNKRVSFAEVR